MTQYLADTGLPFTDRDAAEFKAERMSEESGVAFDVVVVDDGYALEPSPTDIEVCEDTAIFLEEALLDYAEVPDGAIGDERAFVLPLRPAWRAQYVGFSVMLLGLLLVIAPTWPIALFSTEMVTAVNTQFPNLWDDIVLLGIALLLYGTGAVFWQRFYQHSVITYLGVTQSVGIVFNRHVSEISWSNIHVIDVKQPHLVHMLLNFGTVELSTPGSSGADVAIVDVVAPRRLATFIREQMELVQSLHEDIPPAARNRP
jgi:hypothetical protein